MKIRLILCSLVLTVWVGGLSWNAFAASHESKKMSCADMFKKAEGMLSANQKLAIEKKTAMYEMAIKAYNMCKKSQAEMKEAEEFFKKVFESSDKM